MGEYRKSAPHIPKRMEPDRAPFSLFADSGSESEGDFHALAPAFR